jgi:4-hydroxybenzoate polyprenyltransferase/phosphoserine phosphatase
MPTTSSTVVCVDLDGTLIAGDLFWESLLMLIRRQPWLVLLLPYWLLRGRAYTKRQVATRVTLDPAALPYRPEVLAYMQHVNNSGRQLVLATASDEIQARSIAAHLGMFSTVHASDGRINLSGRRKADHLVGVYGSGGFDYVGNGEVDIPAWTAAGRAIVAGAPSRVIRMVRQRLSDVNVLTADPAPSTRAMAAALRPVQWIKNLLIFVPLIASHSLFQADRLRAALATFAAFCLAASAVYVCNDLLDIQSDRLHPRKRRRPFASGALSIPTGVAMFSVLIVAAFGVAWGFASLAVCGMVALYFTTSTIYSVWLKKLAILDVFVLTGLYVLRVFAGGVATSVVLSAWLLGFALFAFLSLALLKRYTELATMSGQLVGRGYSGADEMWLLVSGMLSGYTATVVLALYVASTDVMALYTQPQRLWWLCPLLLMWFSRLWLNASRRVLTDDPIREAISDPLTYVVVAGSAAALVLAL